MNIISHIYTYGMSDIKGDYSLQVLIFDILQVGPTTQNSNISYVYTEH